MATDRLRLPTGLQTFRDVRERGCYYADKTEYVLQAAEDDKFLFLTRPRRFGKTLFLDTLAELYAGNKSLFRGLAVHDRWDWSRRHPVVRLGFARGNFNVCGYLHTNTMVQLERIARRAGVSAAYDTAPERFGDLIETLHESTGLRAVVLVDEYDKPILDALGDAATADANRDYLRGLYGTIKDCDAHIEKCFVIGICRFPRTSLFSTANQFTDLTLDSRYDAVCGFTDDELDRVFAPELPGLDRDAIRQRYNGYSWGDGGETVYNPYDALLLFRTREFADHWWETGTPAFLVEHLHKRGLLAVGDLDGRWVAKDRLSDFDVGRMDAAALLFQTGNLTIGRKEAKGGRPGYYLAYPNEEVRHGMGWLMTLHMVGDTDVAEACGEDLRAAVANADLGLIEATLRTLYSSLPHQQLATVDRHEALYAVALRALAMGAGIRSSSEESTALGRSDVTLKGGGNVFVFEFKMKGRGDPLEQAARKGYADKHRNLGGNAHLVGVTMDPATRNVERFDSILPFAARGTAPRG